MPLVSLIVRSTDRPTLDDTLASIAAQTCTDVEVVVVNAKGAGHRDLPERVSGLPLRRIDGPGPLSRSAAANHGLRAAGGRFLGFVDDDDLILPDHLHLLTHALTHSREPVAYSGARMEVFDTQGAVCRTVVMNQPFHKPSLRAQNYIPIHTVLFDRRLLDAGCAFDEGLSHYEDWDFWLQLAEYTDFHHVDAVTAVYRNFGHSGFGLTHDADAVSRGRAALFAKWGARWSGDNLAAAFAAVLEGVVHRQDPGLEAWARAQSEARQQLEAERDRLLVQCRDAQARVCQLETDARQLSDAVYEARAAAAESADTCARLQRSLSWRLTAPLRGLRRWWRASLSS